MYYGTIKKMDTSDGPGIRVGLYVSGCRNHCKGCHNPETWNFFFGKLFTDETSNNIIKYLKPDFIKGFTLCGGEPMEEENQREVVSLLKRIKSTYPDKDIWLWTGYEYEDLLEGGKKHCEVTEEILSYVDVAVVGPFVLEQRDISNANVWRGSRNQRVVNVKESLKQNKKIYLENIPNNN